MKATDAYRIVVGIILLAFWWHCSGTLTGNPNLTLAIIPISLGMLTAIAIVVQLFLRKGIQAKMKEILDSEIEERREDLIEGLKELVSYLEQTKYPSYSESGAEGLEDDFREFDAIKSKYTFEPKIIKSAILIIVSSLILTLFWVNPTLWIHASDTANFTLAHIGIGLFAIGLWLIFDMLVISLEIQPWEKERARFI